MVFRRLCPPCLAFTLFFGSMIFVGPVACKSTQKDFSDVIEIPLSDVSSSGKTLLQLGAASSQSFPISENGKQARIDWFDCQIQSANQKEDSKPPYFVVLDLKNFKFDSNDICSHPLLQPFGFYGYSLLVVDLSNLADVTGQVSLGGVQEMGLLSGWYDQIRASKDIRGIWAYGESVIGAARLAKKVPAQVLVVGNGIFDLEQVHHSTKDPRFKQELDVLFAQNKDDFYDERSIAWDSEGLPKKVFIYHSEANERISSRQAKQFKDILEASGYAVDLQIIAKANHYLDERAHTAVISRVLERLGHAK